MWALLAAGPNWLAGLFPHKHKWKEYRLKSEDGCFYYHCRECECGADEIRNVGPMGDRKWQSRSIPVRQAWEQELIDKATRID